MANDDMSHDELKMYERLYELMGARVRVGCDRTIYQGIVGTIITGLRMVTLRHASLITGEYLGVARFRFREITSLTVVESGEVVNRYPKNDYLLDILKNKPGKKYRIGDVLYDGQLSDVSDDDEESVDEKPTEQQFNLELPFHLKNQLPNEYVLIDSLDIDFTNAVEDVSNQCLIGVSFDGPNVSRFGNLTSLCISTSTHVYLFDMEILKNEAFDNGLKDIFENPSIKKIIHDCRFPSDCLAHQYSTQLINVFDTLVADFIVSKQCYNDKYEFKYVNSLDCCLRNHLNVPPEFLHNRVTGLSVNEKMAYFTKRPISNEFQYDLMKNALYLILLHKTLAKKLLGPLHKNVNAYLGVLANATTEEFNILGSELSPPDSLPPSILMYGIQTVKFQKPEKESPLPFECKFINPKTGKYIELEKELIPKNDKKKVSNEINKVCVLQKNLSNPNRPAIKSEIVDTVILQPSGRHLDEVYHKLCNNLNLRSQHSESVIHAKPSANYVSKFTVRRPFSGYSSQNIDVSSDLSACHDVNSTSENLSSQNASNSMQNVWAQIYASSNKSTAMSAMKKKIRFVPAGMY